MSERNDIAQAWKDPEDALRASAPAHPSGSADLAEVLGGLRPDMAPHSEVLGSFGCCPSWADQTC